MKKWIALLSALALCLSLAACGEKDPRPAAYEEASALLEAGEYAQAAEAFEALADYEDAADKAAIARETLLDGQYNQALDLLSAGDYAAAYAAFEALGDYKNASTYLDSFRILEDLPLKEEAENWCGSEFIYDETGRLIAVTGQGVTDLCRLPWEARNFYYPTADYRAEYEYDEAGRLIAVNGGMTGPGGEEITERYSCAYDETGLLLSAELNSAGLGGTVTYTMSYDENNRLTGVESSRGRRYSFHLIEYDAAGHISLAQSEAERYEYSYGGDGKLQAATVTSYEGDGQGQWTVSFTYGPDGGAQAQLTGRLYGRQLDISFRCVTGDYFFYNA